MGEELAIVNSAVIRHGEGGMTELGRALKEGSTVGQLAKAQRCATLS
jgi:hypothetical protein